MMQSLIDAVKVFGPAGVRFLILVLAVGVVLAFHRRTGRAARWYFALVLAGYWIPASPACSEQLVRWEGGAYRPVANASEARGARTVVVLGAGNSSIQSRGLSINQVSWEGALRLLEGARLYRMLDRPTIIVSGGVTQPETGAASEADATEATITPFVRRPGTSGFCQTSSVTHWLFCFLAVNATVGPPLPKTMSVCP